MNRLANFPGAWGSVSLVAIILLGAAFRLYMLTTVPSGLYLDEVLSAQHAVLWRLSADKAWFHATPLFEVGQAETSNFYLAGASVVMWVFGRGFLATRMLSVLPSLLCLPLLYLLARFVADRRTALIAAFLLAVSHWAARTGRDGWDEVAMTAFQIAVLVSVVRALKSDRLVWSAMAGLLLGACLYTYVASRLVFLQVGAWLMWEVLSSSRKRRVLAHAVITLGIALVCAAPYYHYLFTKSAGGFNARVSQLTLGGGHTGPVLLHSLIAHLGMFNVRGGTYARDNLPGWPMLDPITGLLFLAGLGVVYARGGRSRRLNLTWFVVCILGGVLSQSREGPPYVYRVANLAPWACLVAAIGSVWVWDHIRLRMLRWGAVLAAIAVLGSASATNAWILFVRGPTCPDFGPAFGTSETQIGLWLAHHPEARPCHVRYETLHSLDRFRPTLWYPETNGYNWYRPGDSAAALHLTANLYRHDPGRARDALALRSDVDLLVRLPDHLSAPAVFVVPPGLIETVSRYFVIETREDLSDDLGRNLGTILRVRSPEPTTIRR